MYTPSAKYAFATPMLPLRAPQQKRAATAILRQNQRYYAGKEAASRGTRKRERDPKREDGEVGVEMEAETTDGL